MPPTSRRRTTLRALALTATGAAALAAGAGAPTQGVADVASDRAAAQSLKQKVAAESAKIEATNAGLASAERRLATLDSRVELRTGQLERTQDELVRSRARLTKLERKADRATRVLSKNLATAYESGRPDLVSVVLTSDGFSDLLERVDFLERISEHNGHILDDTRRTKNAVADQARDLEKMRGRYRTLAKDAVADRDQADVVRNAILRRKQAQLAARAGTAAELGRVKSRIARLERQQAAAARAAASAATATRAAPRVAASSGSGSGGSGSGSNSSGGPSSAPAASDQSGVVGRVVAAANEIASTPYVWGGGHGGASGGYDCSGSISYALAAGGLLDSPLASGPFMSWGEPGPGKRITIYANAGHAYMVVDGRRFDTSNLRGGGTRWTSEMRSSAGFVARHPPGF
jgi:peptidoglycan hydrolase CwlO-like protein